VVRSRSVAAENTAERGLIGTVSLVDVSAQFAFTRGIAGIDNNNLDAGQERLVFDEGAELEEAPVGVSCPLLSL
jgi:hypothetical protein